MDGPTDPIVEMRGRIEKGVSTNSIPKSAAVLLVGPMQFLVCGPI